jgi:hypothetical protein
VVKSLQTRIRGYRFGKPISILVKLRLTMCCARLVLDEQDELVLRIDDEQVDALTGAHSKFARSERSAIAYRANTGSGAQSSWSSRY